MVWGLLCGLVAPWYLELVLLSRLDPELPPAMCFQGVCVHSGLFVPSVCLGREVTIPLDCSSLGISRMVTFWGSAASDLHAAAFTPQPCQLLPRWPGGVFACLLKPLSTGDPAALTGGDVAVMSPLCRLAGGSGKTTHPQPLAIPTSPNSPPNEPLWASL